MAKEVVRFVAADAIFDDARPVRYSLLFDPHPMVLPTAVGQYGKPGGPKLLKLREAILTSYHHNEVRRACALLTHGFHDSITIRKNVTDDPLRTKVRRLPDSAFTYVGECLGYDDLCPTPSLHKQLESLDTSRSLQERSLCGVCLVAGQVQRADAGHVPHAASDRVGAQRPIPQNAPSRPGCRARGRHNWQRGDFLGGGPRAA